MDVTEPSSDSDTPGFNLAGELARSALSAPPASRSKAVRDLSRSSSLSARARMDVGGMLREERSCTKKKQQPRTRSTRHQPQSKFKLQLGLGCDRSSRHAERRSGKQQPHPKRQRASSSAAHKRQPTKKAKATQLKAVDVPECDNRMQFTESPSRAMEESFAWNDKCVSCLSLAYSSSDLPQSHYPLFPLQNRQTRPSAVPLPMQLALWSTYPPDWQQLRLNNLSG